MKPSVVSASKLGTTSPSLHYGENRRIFEKLLALHNPENNSFEILGVQISDSLEDIQKIWKEMVKNNHPDKLVGQGMPIEFIESANQKLAIINSAYEEIKNLRT